MNRKIFLLFTTGILLTFFNYIFAKFIQSSILSVVPSFSYIASISIPWILIGLLPLVSCFGRNGLDFDVQLILKNKRKLFVYSSLIILGLLIFVLLGLTKYFHLVKYPVIFFIVTPIAEELIFRGFVFRVFEKVSTSSPVVFSAVLFGLHHLQYTHYSLTTFAIFQVAYTFVLGLLLGKVRKLSGSIYIGILLHIIINLVSVYY